MAVQTIYPRASELLANSKVAVRVKELQAEQLEAVDVSAEAIVRRAWEIAQQDRADRVSALALLAKRHPEFSDKHDINANVRMQALQAVANMTEDQLLRLAEGGNG